MFEYMLTGKPVFLLIQDYEDYLKKERKLYFAIKELPFEAAFNEQDLLDRIKNFNMERYLDQCRNFMQRVGMEDDGLSLIHIFLCPFSDFISDGIWTGGRLLYGVCDASLRTV